MNRLRFAKYRLVKSPTRSNKGDAGLDFFFPQDLSLFQLKTANSKQGDLDYLHQYVNEAFIGPNQVYVDRALDTEFIQGLILGPHTRILIPSGIKVLIEPMDSMLMAANKSGQAANKGLQYTAEIVDSPYVGEMHLGILNTTNHPVNLDMSKGVVQFIHVPIFLTEPEEISRTEYAGLSKGWGTRGEARLGDHDNKTYTGKPTDIEGD